MYLNYSSTYFLEKLKQSVLKPFTMLLNTSDYTHLAEYLNYPT